MIRALAALFRVGPRRRLAVFAALLIAYSVAQGLAFLAVIPVVRDVATGGPAAALPETALLVLAAAVAALLFYFQARTGYRISLDLMRSLQARIGDHAARLPLGWFSRARSGELAQLTAKNAEDAGSVTAHLLQPTVTAVVSPLVVVVGLLWWDWRLAVVGALALPIAVLVGWLAPKATAKIDAVHDRRTAETNEQLVDFALAQPVIRSAGRGIGSYPPLDRALDRQYRSQLRGVWLVLPGMLANTLVVQLWLLLLLVTSVLLVLDGELADEAAIGLLIVAVRFAGPLIELSEYATSIRAAGDSIERIDAFLRTPLLPEPVAGRRIPERDPGVVFDGVGFGYGAGAPVLDGVSFRCEPGTMTALVGPSGSGKTTVLRLIARFWDVTAGAVRIGGADVRELGSAVVIDRVAVVFQDVMLFEGSILENVRFGRPDASDADVRTAMSAARVLEIADRLPDGVDTQVGEGGELLSGGERQRVSIARALLKDAPIVLLDEATSALDAENEAELAAAFRALAAGRTVIAIAHRLDTIRDADQILVLDEGRIVESGDHETLRAAGGRYARFWEAKESASGWRFDVR